MKIVSLFVISLHCTSLILTFVKCKIVMEWQITRFKRVARQTVIFRSRFLYYSPVWPALQFFSYKRCRNNVNRANGFILRPLGLKNGDSILLGDSDVIRRIASCFRNGWSGACKMKNGKIPKICISITNLVVNEINSYIISGSFIGSSIPRI